jgi:hypothetical protein
MHAADDEAGSHGIAGNSPAAKANTTPPSPPSVREASVIEQLEPTEDDLFYVEWGRESVKHNLVLANDILQRLVTLNGVLLAGSIAFYDERILPNAWKPYVIGCFLLSLIVSFLGMIPFQGKVDLRVPAAIRAHKEKALKTKWVLLVIAALLIAGGFGISLGAVIHSIAR